VTTGGGSTIGGGFGHSLGSIGVAESVPKGAAFFFFFEKYFFELK
jgi:hypothetical protein